MNQLFTSSTLLVLMIVTVTANVGQTLGEEPTGRQHAVLMEKKLASAQQVLAGLARGNFSEIEKQAQMLNLLSREAAWNIIQTKEYMRMSDSFRDTTTQLSRAAENRNADAVGLAFIKLTISCIDCHRYAAEVRAARMETEKPSASHSDGKEPQ
jgi:hypothetical protein